MNWIFNAYILKFLFIFSRILRRFYWTLTINWPPHPYWRAFWSVTASSIQTPFLTTRRWWRCSTFPSTSTIGCGPLSPSAKTLIITLPWGPLMMCLCRPCRPWPSLTPNCPNLRLIRTCVASSPKALSPRGTTIVTSRRTIFIIELNDILGAWCNWSHQYHKFVAL